MSILIIKKGISETGVIIFKIAHNMKMKFKYTYGLIILLLAFQSMAAQDVLNSVAKRAPKAKPINV